MRARILAIFILIIFVAIPSGLYYYITTKKVASVTFTAGKDDTFIAQLFGTFGVDGLPLADKALSYNKVCTYSCTFAPVIPAQYTVTLTSSGRADIVDNFVVSTGDKIDKAYTFTDDVIITSVGNITRDDSLMGSLIENASSQKIGEFAPIGIDIMSRAWVVRKTDTASQIGILSTERFLPIRRITTPLISSSIDGSRSVIILRLAGDRILFLPIDLSSEKEITMRGDIEIGVVVPGEMWKIKTPLMSYRIQGNQIMEDIRFTDSIDISPRIRIGYIDKSDTKKLSLGNFPAGVSVLVRLDRNTGESIVLRKGLDINAFFYYKEKPVYMDLSGNIFTLDINPI